MAVGILEVQLVKGKNLSTSEEFFGRTDPYVLVQYKSQQRKSRVARDISGADEGRNPQWNETLRLKVEYPGQHGNDYKLVLKIMDKDNFSADDFIGQAVIYVKDLLISGVENGTAEMHPTKYSVVRADQTYKGEIQVGLKFTLQDEGDDGEEYGGWKESKLSNYYI